MSHLSEIELRVLSIENLATAAFILGMRLEQRETFHSWQTEKCDYAITIPGNKKAFEVGVRAQPDGSYTLHWDFYEGGYGLEKVIGKDGCMLVSEYEAVTYKAVMAAEGYEMSEIIMPDGSREITATQYN